MGNLLGGLRRRVGPCRQCDGPGSRHYDWCPRDRRDAGTGLDSIGPPASTPVITAILSAAGTATDTVGTTKSYTSWSFLANDGTGSTDVFGKMPTGNPYTPNVGDAISATGTYSPYNQIPELESLTAIRQVSTGNAVPTPGTATISQLNVNTLPLNIAGYEWTIDDVTISGISGVFDSSNLTGTITDTLSNGNDSMTLYYWESSYSAAFTNLGGTAIPTGPVNITGFGDVFNNTSAEFIPISISPYTATPEPGTLVLLGAGLAAAAVLALHRKKVSG